MEKHFSAKEVAALLGYKNEETIKRYLRNEETRRKMFPNAFIGSRKEGWKIPASDLALLTGSTLKEAQIEKKTVSADYDELDLVKLAYQLATLSSPTEEVLKALTYVGIQRALEICLIIRQQSKPLEKPHNFVKAAISKGWKPDPIASDNFSVLKKSLVDFTQRDYEKVELQEQQKSRIPLYNWLEQE